MAGRGARELDRGRPRRARAGSASPQTPNPKLELDRLLEGFVERFGSLPISNAGATAARAGRPPRAKKGNRADRRCPNAVPELTYRGAGVDIDAGDALVERIKGARPPHDAPRGDDRPGRLRRPVRAARRATSEPLLVSCTDGVGTKLKLAFLTGRHDTVGIDLVAMSVNDMVVCGAEPLFFLDYFASGKLDVGVAERVIAGIADGCQAAGCALVGGETAELPGLLRRRRIRPGRLLRRRRREEPPASTARAIRAGDRLLGLASSGFHSNGYSLVRRVFLDHMQLPLDADAARARRTARRQRCCARRASTSARCARCTTRACCAGPPTSRAAAWSTTRRACCPADARLQLRIRLGSWPVPPIFDLLARGGDVDRRRDAAHVQHGHRHAGLRPRRPRRRGDRRCWNGAGEQVFSRRRGRRRRRARRARGVRGARGAARERRRPGLGQRHEPAGADRSRPPRRAGPGARWPSSAPTSPTARRWRARAPPGCRRSSSITATTRRAPASIGR